MIKKLFLKIISFLCCRFKNTQCFYVGTKSDFNCTDFNDDREFFEIDNIEDFKKLCKKFDFEVPDADIEERFNQKSIFYMLAEDGHYGCWGWGAQNEKQFNVLEINRRCEIPDDVSVLYHFYTNENYRRRGYYTELLRRIVASNSKKYCIIYAYDYNIASRTAIQKSGFTYIATLKHNGFKGFPDLINQYHSKR